MNTMKLAIGIVVIVAVAVAAYALVRPHRAGGTDQAAVRETVEHFGSEMQQVSLLAPAGDVRAAMEADYGSLVSPELLAQWEADPADAPGRLTSSPWPDHIDIDAVTAQADGTYVVQGSVVEMTSNEVEHGGEADEYPVTLTLANQNGAWVITAYSRGAYVGPAAATSSVPSAS
jgi:hypothetical protein